jgi:precorrin-2/cobalt-factor-2 C20-methyltransferase
VYLPAELKDRLAAVAVRSGRSEAELIRRAIDQLVSGTQVPPAGNERGPFVAPRPSVFAVGMGPGDPELITVHARAVIAGVDRVVVLTTDVRAVGRAEMVVRAVAPDARVVRVAFAIATDEGARHRSLLAAADAVLAATDAGEAVAVAMLGDPSQWTIAGALIDELARQRPELHIGVVPAVSAYQSAAAHAGITLGSHGAPLIVVDNLVDLDAFLARRDATVVLFKASTDAESVQQLARQHDRAGCVSELTGLPGERTTPVEALAEGPISYLATVIFPSSVMERTVAR